MLSAARPWHCASVVTRYGAAPVPNGNPATIDAFLTRLIRQALHHPRGYVPLQDFPIVKQVLLPCCCSAVDATEGMQKAEASHCALAG